MMVEHSGPTPETQVAQRTRFWSRALAWLRTPEALVWGLLGGAFVTCYVAVLLSRPLFAPDSQYYVGMSLRFGGMDRTEAWQTAVETPLANGWHPATEDYMFGLGLVQPRLVLPILGIPFTKAFGPYGLAVVTGLATAVLVWLLVVVARRRYGLGAALVPVLLVITSPLLMFFGAAMLTESLTAVWAALILLAVWRYQEGGGRAALAGAAALTLVFAFTRQATFIVAGALVVAWLAALLLRQDHRRWRWPALVVGGTALGAQLLQLVLFPSYSQTDQFLRMTGTDSLGEAVRAAPRLGLSILKSDLATFAEGDHALLVLIALSLTAIVLRWRDPSSHLLVGALLGIVLYTVTNGVPTQFRYAMPGLVFYVLAAAGLLSQALPALTGRRPAPASGPPEPASGEVGTPTT